MTPMTRRTFFKAAAGLALSSGLPVARLAVHAAAAPPLALAFPRMGDHFRVMETTRMQAAPFAYEASMGTIIQADEIVRQIAGGRVCLDRAESIAGYIDAALLHPLEAVSAPSPTVGAWAFVSSTVATLHAYASHAAPLRARHVHGEQVYVLDVLDLRGVGWLGIAWGIGENIAAWTRAEQWRMRPHAPAPDLHIDRITLSPRARTLGVERADARFSIPIQGRAASNVWFSGLTASDLFLQGLPGGSQHITTGALTTEPAFAHWWQQSVPRDATVELIE